LLTSRHHIQLKKGNAMSSVNPFEPPRAVVEDVRSEPVEFQPVKVWSARGRVGRLRYLAYFMAGSLVAGMAEGIMMKLVGPDGHWIALLLVYIPFVVLWILTTIQRSHDMNWSGWTWLLTIIPFVALIWVVGKGTEGENEYGAPPPPNTWGVKLLAFLFPLAFVLGILAAVSLPAYQDYVKRSKAAEMRR
jgi:uncharacterized membrane protein YhaH (DUF805 family)